LTLLGLQGFADHAEVLGHVVTVVPIVPVQIINLLAIGHHRLLRNTKKLPQVKRLLAH
jgi:hypothetical protein